MPAFVAGSYFADTTAAKVAIYEVMLCEISISILLFSLSLGASRAISITAALGTCIVFLPFCEPTIIYSVVQIAPNVGSQIAGALLTGAAFIQFGRRNWLADLPYAMIVFGLLTWMVLVGITVVLLSGPFLLLCAVSGTIAAGSTAERWRKIGLSIAAYGLVLKTAVSAIYLVGVILDTAAVTFPAELADDRASFFFASMLFHWKSVGPVGPLLVICAIAGAIIAICDRSQRTLRIFAIALLTYLGTRLAFAVFIVVFDFWRGPAVRIAFRTVRRSALWRSSPCYSMHAGRVPVAPLAATPVAPLGRAEWHCHRAVAFWPGDRNDPGSRVDHVAARVRISLSAAAHRNHKRAFPGDRAAAGFADRLPDWRT